MSSSNPDLNLLLVFEAMLLHRNVTAAANHMGITQSAMSSALGRLRRQYGDTLFVNTRNGMLPTPRALELSKPLERALALIRSTSAPQQEFNPRESRRTFRIHMSDVGEIVLLPALVKRLDELEVSVRVETLQLSSDQIRRQIESGEIDFAVGYLPRLKGNVESCTLFREHYVCMARSGHPFATSRTMSTRDFLAASHIFIESMGSGHRIIERTLEQAGHDRHVAIRLPHFMVVPMIVAQTDRVVTVPSRVAGLFESLMPVRTFAVPIHFPDFDVALFWHPRFAHDPGIVWMRALLTELFRERVPRKRVPDRS